jgi:hypothetical protein
MNYGDGWYGGVYVAAMYALSFYTDDIPFIVEEALRSIPEESQFFQCIHDVIIWHSEYPDDWKQTWFEVERKWSSDIGCPDGVFRPFNIDAKINAAYIVIGMLYGEGDFGLTLDISTRCGQDSDCNPASAGGVLGTILGYEGIPSEWKAGLDRVEDMDFKYTTISLNDTYEMGYKQAVGMVERNGGSAEGDILTIPMEEPSPVALEVAFEGHYPVRIERNRWSRLASINSDQTEYEVEFEGIGFVIGGGAQKQVEADKVLTADIYLDGELYEQATFPTNFQSRRLEVAWGYKLENGPHKARIVWTNPEEGYRLDVNSVLVYGPVPGQ